MIFSKASVYGRLGLLGALGAPWLTQLHGHQLTLWGCPLKALVGIPCPTWGLTRAVVAIANHQWFTALQYHLLAPLVVLLWGVAMVQLTLELATRRRWSCWWQRRRFWLTGLILLFSYHGYRLYGLWQSGILATHMQQSLLGHHLL